MEELRLIFNLCYQIMSINITLYGYTFNLFSVLAFSLAGAFVLFIIFKIFY